MATENTMRGKIEDGAQARGLMLAGNAMITLASTSTGARFTYQIVRAKDARPARPINGVVVDDGPFFVRLLNGSNNEADFTYLGTIGRYGVYRHGRKSRVGEDAPSVRAFTWAWTRLNNETIPEGLEVWHEGRCCRCGRKLTVPGSIESGLGPECAQKSAALRAA